MELDWPSRAVALADDTVHPSSPWYGAVAATPRHLLVPRWWRYLADGGGWTLRVGEDAPERWLNAAYGNRTLVTRVGSLHADHATGDDHPTGRPTSSSTLPELVVSMFQHALITHMSDVLCVTGSGYGTGLLADRLGGQRVTSIDVDPYLVRVATDRLNGIGLFPRVEVCDITGTLPGTYDRIVSTVGLPYVPEGWMKALNDDGRLVTNLAGTGMVIVADKTADGGAKGVVTQERAGFMATRSGDDYPPAPSIPEAWTGEGEDVSIGRYPVVRVTESWELMSMFALAAPGVEHSYDEDADGTLTVVTVHEDGSWARAAARSSPRATGMTDRPTCRSPARSPVSGSRTRPSPAATTATAGTIISAAAVTTITATTTARPGPRTPRALAGTGAAATVDAGVGHPATQRHHRLLNRARGWRTEHA